MKTQELNEYIKHYLEKDKTHSAIMLKGAWGTGKSHYIRTELVDYLKEEDAESFIIVYENGETEHLYHSYGIDYENTKWSKGEYVPGNMIVSSVDDTGYSFSHDIDEEHIIGFYDLTYKSGKKVKETFMEEIIKNLD